jgi:RNA polymerase sigma-70 factor (ECF subfamily)
MVAALTRTFAPEGGLLLQSEWTLAPIVEELFGPTTLKDDLLRMLFSCCHPRLPEAAPVALVLHILCGFNIDKIASALVSTHTTIEKRISERRKCSQHRRAVRRRAAGPASPRCQVCDEFSGCTT